MSSADTISFLSLGISAISLIVAVVSAFFSYRFSSKSTVPSINHYLKNLPPYSSSQNTTQIIIKNEGTAQAKIHSIYLRFSWDKSLEMWLYNDEEGEMFLNPNETVTFNKNIPQPPNNKKGRFYIKTIYDNDMWKEDCYELNPRELPMVAKV